jgi:hypothetical protein
MTTDAEEEKQKEKEKRISISRGAKSAFDRTTLNVRSSFGLSTVERTRLVGQKVGENLVDLSGPDIQRHAEQLCISISVHILCQIILASV